VPVAFSSSPSLSFLNRRLKNPVSLSFVSFESFVGLEGPEYVLVEVFGVLILASLEKMTNYFGISCVFLAVVSPNATASCSRRFRSYGPSVFGIFTLKSMR